MGGGINRRSSTIVEQLKQALGSVVTGQRYEYSSMGLVRNGNGHGVSVFFGPSMQPSLPQKLAFVASLSSNHQDKALTPLANSPKLRLRDPSSRVSPLAMIP